MLPTRKQVITGIIISFIAGVIYGAIKAYMGLQCSINEFPQILTLVFDYPIISQTLIFVCDYTIINQILVLIFEIMYLTTIVIEIGYNYLFSSILDIFLNLFLIIF